MIIVSLKDRPEFGLIVASWIYYQWWSRDPEQSPGTVAEAFATIGRTNRVFGSFVALENSTPIGTATVLDHDVGTERRPDLTPWIAAVYVTPGMRRKGVGTSLVSHARTYAHSEGYNTIYLCASDRTPWYRHLGWQVIEQFDRNGVPTSFLKIDRAA